MCYCIIFEKQPHSRHIGPPCTYNTNVKTFAMSLSGKIIKTVDFSGIFMHKVITYFRKKYYANYMLITNYFTTDYILRQKFNN